MTRWTQKERDQLRDLAATGTYASEIAAIIGTSHASVVATARQNGIPVNRYTPEEEFEMAQRRRAKQQRKNARRRGEAVPTPSKNAPIVVFNPLLAAGRSKTSAAYRNCLPRIGERSKSELRAMIADAVRNTAEARV